MNGVVGARDDDYVVEQRRRAAEAAAPVDDSYADVVALQPVARASLLKRLGLLTHSETERLARRLSVYLGLCVAREGFNTR